MAQFESQGVDLSGIITTAAGRNADGTVQHPVLEHLDALRAQLGDSLDPAATSPVSETSPNCCFSSANKTLRAQSGTAGRQAVPRGGVSPHAPAPSQLPSATLPTKILETLSEDLQNKANRTLAAAKGAAEGKSFVCRQRAHTRRTCQPNTYTNLTPNPVQFCWRQWRLPLQKTACTRSSTLRCTPWPCSCAGSPTSSARPCPRRRRCALWGERRRRRRGLGVGGDWAERLTGMFCGCMQVASMTMEEEAHKVMGAEEIPPTKAISTIMLATKVKADDARVQHAALLCARFGCIKHERNRCV